MNKKNIPIIVQLKQNNNQIVQGINQYDAGVLFDIKIMDGLESFDFSGYSVVTLFIKKPDGTITVDSNGGTNVDVIDPVNGRLKINIPTSCTAQNGMHFCRVGFSNDEETYLQTMSFNYFVGEVDEIEDEDIIGTNQYPILSNFIAMVAGALSAEQVRVQQENERQEAEDGREIQWQNILTQVTGTLYAMEDAIVNAQLMLEQVYEAIAEGGSIDVSEIQALATKTFVLQKLNDLDFGDLSEETKTKTLQVTHGPAAAMPTLKAGEFYYQTDGKALFIGGETAADFKMINAPMFTAQTTAPSDTNKLWIDTTLTSPVIKYYNGSAWISCNTAVYA